MAFNRLNELARAARPHGDENLTLFVEGSRRDSWKGRSWRNGGVGSVMDLRGVRGDLENGEAEGSGCINGWVSRGRSTMTKSTCLVVSLS